MTAIAPPQLALKRPEILAPAGNEDMMKAAVENGADAIYFGLQELNARLRATNFAPDDLPRIMAWLHERGVRGYVTLNTLVFTRELDHAAELLLACSRSGVDAVLVQDIGLARLGRDLVPDLPIHASTQMTIAGPESVHALESMGIALERLVAARELSRRELARLTRGVACEVEVFVHGAVCVAYSGQCLTSEALGGRSANRGQCAQACRLPYDLIVDGEHRDLDDVRYLLSPKDLAAYEDIGDLVRAGVVSFKIEGRYKSPEYVAATVQAYRRAIDDVFRDTEHLPNPTLDKDTRLALEQTFSRGFTPGWLHQMNHQEVVEGRNPRKRGPQIGVVQRLTTNGIEARVDGPLRPGDGLLFESPDPEDEPTGGRVYALYYGPTRLDAYEPDREPKVLRLVFARDAIKSRLVKPGGAIWKTSDPVVEARLRATWQVEQPRFQRPVSATVTGTVDEPLRLVLADTEGNRAEVDDTHPAEAARNRPLTSDLLREQFGRLGGTPFVLDALDVQLDGELMVPVSRLNDMRRRAVDLLIQQRRRRATGRRENPAALDTWRAQIPKSEFTPDTALLLGVLCRTLEQVAACHDNPRVSTIYTDFEDIRLHREARALVTRTDVTFAPATIRVVKPGEAPFITKLLDARPDAILLRNLAAWHILRQRPDAPPLLGDFSLNVTNELSAHLLRQQGLRQIVPGYDLNFDQLADLLRASPPEWYEITIHQYMPMFHMEHCVFCRFLSTGTDFTNCGRPCETHHLAVRDRMGLAHPVKADMGCRNTVFNASAQSAAEYLGALCQLGARRFRIDLLDESAAATAEVIDTYAAALDGRLSGRETWSRLRARSKLGVTRGSLDHE